MSKLGVIVILFLVAVEAMAQVNVWEGVARHKSVMLTPYLADSDSGGPRCHREVL